MSCKADLVAINSLSFSLSGKVSISFLKDFFFFARYSVFGWQFVFHHFEYIIPLTSDLHGFCWEICWKSYKNSLVCNKFVFSCCFPIMFLSVTVPTKSPSRALISAYLCSHRLWNIPFSPLSLLFSVSLIVPCSRRAGLLIQFSCLFHSSFQGSAWWRNQIPGLENWEK